ncbi:hypothetical protein GGP41_005601 [Bipolaris sorokiniana]|uniref:Uncharacterized protein n=1 Tax=Cochliobolus sativus TaxID=45130 RepID=A0A8H5ZFA3_COCSA|nr:hypothetical protein GGP41_005601 [Bipolaris sorokiniana]
MEGPASASPSPAPSPSCADQRAAAVAVAADTPNQEHSTLTTPTTASLLSAAHPNAASTLTPSDLSFELGTTDPSLPRYHVRAPSTALKLDTDLAISKSTSSRAVSLDPANLDANGSDALRQSATAPIAIQDGYLRTAWSTASLGSLSPGSAISSPALNALGDITPLPSPLVMGDSPGPWQRAEHRPRSRGFSGASRDDSVAMFAKGTLSPSPSLKKKGYSGLKAAAIEAAAANSHQKNEAARERNRSVSEYTPDSMYNARPRHVTIGNTAVEPDGTAAQHRMNRETYLATQRGLVPAKVPAGLPTPPASNASNRSVTDTEEEDFGDEDGEWDAEKGKEWAGARECVEGLLKKVSRGRKSLEDIEKTEWVQQGIQVEGGLKTRPEDEVTEEISTEIPAR